MVYHYLVTSYANSGGLQTATWSLNSLSFVSGISNFIIRAMFARRIYQFGRRSIVVPAWIMAISICDLVVAIVTSAEAFYWQGVKPIISKLLYISFALGVTADLSVTVALAWLLQSAKSGFRKSDSVVNVLMAYVVNTGLLVTVVATVGLIMYIVMPHNLVFLAFFMLLGKLYLNAYLATLTARGRLRGKSESGSVPLPLLGASNSQGRDTLGVFPLNDEKTRSHSTMSISFQQVVERRVDDVSDPIETPPQSV